MNELIADSLAQHILDLDFISKTGGCIQTILVPVKDKKQKKIPGCLKCYYSPEEQFCGDPEDYTPMIPDSKYVGLSFCEDLGEHTESHSVRMERVKGKLKVVCWLNMDKIGYDDGLGMIQKSFRDHLGNFNPISDQIHGFRFKILRTHPKRPGPFEKFDLDEKTNQFLVLPYDYFSFEVEYSAFCMKNCLVEININPVQC